MNILLTSHFFLQFNLDAPDDSGITVLRLVSRNENYNIVEALMPAMRPYSQRTTNAKL